MEGPAAPHHDPDLHGKTVWAIDTLSRVYQLFHALPEMSAPDGTPVSVVYGLTRDLLDIVSRRRPDFLLCAMDAAGPTFRHALYADYKANRPEMPADLVPQIPLVRRLLEVMGIPCLELPGFEADDLLATVAAQVVDRGGTCTIATADKDARQLLGSQVRLFNLRSNQAFGPDELRTEWGIGPEQVVDFLALVGDAVDNVPGVPGIGPKTASELLQRYGTLDALLDSAGEIRQAKRRESLLQHAETARAGRTLIRLDVAAPVHIPWEQSICREPDSERLAAFLREMGFRSLLAKVATARDDSGPRSRAAASGGTLFELEPRQASPEPAGQRRAKPGVAAHGSPTVPARQPASLTVLEFAADDEVGLAAACRRLRAAGSVGLCAVAPPRGGHPPALGLATTRELIWIASANGWGDLAPSVRDLLADAALPKRGHDLKRQTVALRSSGLPLAGAEFDTMLAAYLLEAGERNLALVETARRHGVAIDAALPEGGAATVDAPTQPEAAAVHAWAVDDLTRRLTPALTAAGLDGLFRDVEMPLATVLADMEWRGMRIDTERLVVLSADYATRLAGLEREIFTLAGHEFAIASPLQVRGVLFDEIGLPVVKRTKTGPSTDAEVLEELARHHPLPAMLLEHRRYAKLKSTYVDALPALVHPGTGRIHTSLNQTITATGRLSSSDPNLQNIPVRSVEGQQIRAAFRPGPSGWSFVAADYSQIELRVLAHLSGDRQMCAAFAAGEDIHTRTAALVHGVEPAAVTPAMRRAAKAVNFGILYGQSAFGLAKALGISQAEAAAFIRSYFTAFAGAAAYIDDLLDRCRQDGQVTTLLGRRRAIRGVRGRAARRTTAGVPALSLPERTAINTVVQGSAADMIKLAMLRVSRRLAVERMAAALVLQIHDELLLEAPAAEVPAVAALTAEEMRSALPLQVPLVVVVRSGETWAECEK
jgi:DNA polymerase-1